MGRRGQVLTELLIALTIGVVLATMGAQLLTVSLDATRTSESRGEAVGLAQEGLEAVRAIAQGNDAASQGWNRIYLPPDGTGLPSASKGPANPYHPEIVANAWRLVTGSEVIVISGTSYTRKIIIENVCRSNTTKDITGVEPCVGGSSDDPQTQNVTVTVSRAGQPDVILTEFFSRYANEASLQTGWTGAQSCGPVGATSSPAIYCSQTCIDRTAGSMKLTVGC